MLGRLRTSSLIQPIRDIRNRVLPVPRIQNTGFSLFDDDRSRADPQKTFVVFGVPRGGTTMIAGVLVGLGIDMGPDLPQNLEDAAFHAPPKDLPQVVQDRNITRDIWGWKHPSATNYIDQILGDLRNPRLICITRDPVASALGGAIRAKLPPAQVLQDNLILQQKNLMTIQRLQRPSLLLSYERATRAPDATLAEIADFLCTPLPTDTRALISFMVPGTYKTRPPST